MMHFKRFTAFFLAALIVLTFCACGKKEEADAEESFIRVDAELAYNSNVIVMLSSEEDIFKESICPDDIEFYAHLTEETETVKFDVENVVYQSPTRVGLNLELGKDIDFVSVKIAKGATLTGKNLFGSTSEIIHTFGAGDDTVALDVKKIKEMLEKGVLDYGTAIISCGVQAYGVLKTLGLVEDENRTRLELIQESINQVTKSIDSLNLKLDSMYENLKVELDKINNTTKENLRTSYASAWMDFKTDYLDKNGGISQQILKFNNNYSTVFCGFSSRKSGSFAIYYDVDGNVTKPVSASKPKTGEWLSLDNKVIDETKTVTFNITADTFKESAGITIKSIDNELYMKTFSSDLREALLTAENVSEENIDAVFSDALSAISIDAVIETLNSKGENGTIADDIIDNFTLFCDRLTDKDLNPIDVYHKLISTHYNFQREAEKDIESFNKFILTTTAQGCAYAELASKFGSIQESKKASVHETAEKVALFFETHDGYMAEKEGAEYCYTTAGYLAGTQFTLTSRSTVKSHLKDCVFYVAGALDSYELTMTWNSEPKDVISTSDLQDIYAVYCSLYKSGITSLSFRDYYISALCMDSMYAKNIINKKASGLISGTGIEKRSFALDGSTTLLCYMDAFDGRYKDRGAVIYGPCEYFTVGKQFKIGTESTSDNVENAYFAEHCSMYGNVMDIDACKFYNDKQLVSHAIYAEDHLHWVVAEIWHFVGAADLTNKDAWVSYNYDGSGDTTRVPIRNLDQGRLWDDVTITATFWGIVNVPA